MNELKDKIVSYIKRAQKDFNITLVSEEWGDSPTKCACALGCVLLGNDYYLSGDNEINAEIAAEILGVSEEWTENFIYGFDGDPAGINNPQGEAWRLGLEIRNELNPISHTDYVNGLDPMVLQFIEAMETK